MLCLERTGVGIALPAAPKRIAGDIDLWVEGGRERILEFLNERKLEVKSIVLHHAEVEIFQNIDTEIHFMPIWMYNPIRNHRLQRFFREQADQQFSHDDEKAGFCYPTAAFNVVYVLVHTFHHLLDEGVGLRQVMDYYYVLRSYATAVTKRMAEEKDRGQSGALRR